MKTPKPSTGYHRTNLKSVMRMAPFVALVALIVIPLFSSSSASSSKQALRISQSSAANNVRHTAVRSDQKSAIAGQISSLAPAGATLGSWSSSTFGMLLPLPVPQQINPPLATYAADCITPKTTFVLGDTVCAKATGLVGYRFAWVDSAGFIRQRTDITTDPQNDSFTLPSTPTSVVNGTTVDNRGEWRVNAITSRGSLKSSAFFTVKDPENPATDLSITKTLAGDGPVENGPAQFSILIVNHGPDDGANVHFVDNQFTNATFNSVTQTEGLPFICTGSGSADCTIAVFPKGSEARFLLNFTAGTAGATLNNTASVTSDTAELNPADNNSSSAPIKIGSGAAPPACILDCPENINANADTTENNQRGAHVNYDPPQTSGTCGTVTSSPPSGSFFPVGTTIVTATSTEGNGSCSFTITVRDEGNPPVITCPSDKTADANNTCSANVSVGTATTTGGSNVTVIGTRSDGEPMYDCDANGTNCTRKSTDAPFQTGTTTITWTAYSHDIPGPYASQDDEESHRQGSASCTQTINVNDVTPPTINAPPQTASANANCEAPVPDYSNSATDNCACANSDTSAECEGRQRITVTQSIPAGTMVGLGTHTITLTANDGSSNNNGNGNSSTTTTTFTVNDTTAPAISCPADITTGTDAGQCSATVNPGTATATDNCDSTPTVTGTRSDNQALNAPYPQGTTTITWTATDDSNNSSSCTQTVTVRDTGNPTVTCPADITTGTDPGSCSATVNTTATATDNCDSNPTVTGTRSDGQPLNAAYPKGTTTITWSATDASGNHSSSCTQTITVNDTEAPAISCPANITRSTDPGTCSATINPGTATATDNCDTPTVTGTRSDGQALNASYPKGTTTITWTATDGSNNSSSCTQTITVNDTEAPAISCPANITRSTDPGTCSATINPGTATATDNCDTPTVTGTRSDGQALNAPYPKGTTTITWTATDGSNNSSSCTQTITVNDTEAPVITCPANITRSNDPGMCSANINPGTATATDNCGSTTVSGTRSDGGPLNGSYPVGTTTITWTATDTSGNHSSCTQTITVNDTEHPTISCPANITLEPTCPSGAVGTYTAPVGSDNCPGATTTLTAGPASGSVFPIGTTTVTYTVTDAHGNSTSCSFTVTVKTPQAAIQNLIDSVNSSSLSPTTKGGLVSKLNAARDAIDAGQTNVACNKLDAFINSVQNLVSHGDITAAQGQEWINSANHVKNTIGCTQNPCT